MANYEYRAKDGVVVITTVITSFATVGSQEPPTEDIRRHIIDTITVKEADLIKAIDTIKANRANYFTEEAYLAHLDMYVGALEFLREHEEVAHDEDQD